MSCIKPVFISKVADYSIYEVELLTSSRFSAPPVAEYYPRFSARVEKPGQLLAVGGHGEYRNPYRDLTFSESDTCTTYLTAERAYDYSKVSGISMSDGSPLRTMLAAPCEASDGDSGGPIFLRDSSIVVGIVSAGSRDQFSDQDATTGLNWSEEERVPYGKLFYSSTLTIYNEILNFVNMPRDDAPALKAWIETQFVH